MVPLEAAQGAFLEAFGGSPRHPVLRTIAPGALHQHGKRRLGRARSIRDSSLQDPSFVTLQVALRVGEDFWEDVDDLFDWLQGLKRLDYLLIGELIDSDRRVATPLMSWDWLYLFADLLRKADWPSLAQLALACAW
jgi:hypothetical protein